ncbi:MAG: acyltransferase domain-containing protein, partial [Chloroflexota bacterium]
YLETAVDSLADVGYTANTGRAHFEHRLALSAGSPAELRESLLAYAAGRAAVSQGRVKGGQRKRVAFLFTGQGAQVVGMGRQLYETQPTFRRALDRCAAILDDHLEEPLLSVLFEETGGALLDQTAYTQPALFALEYALAELWRSGGVEPDVVMGHSVGEYVAACLDGRAAPRRADGRCLRLRRSGRPRPGGLRRPRLDCRAQRPGEHRHLRRGRGGRGRARRA